MIINQINRKLKVKILSSLLIDFRVVHQTGELDLPRFRKIRESLPTEQQTRYECFSFCSPFEIYKVYKRADVVVGRAGANTVSEVLVAGRPAIYIPIPWSIFNEQERNAKYAQKIGVAKITLGAPTALALMQRFVVKRSPRHSIQIYRQEVR